MLPRGLVCLAVAWQVVVVTSLPTRQAKEAEEVTFKSEGSFLETLGTEGRRGVNITMEVTHSLTSPHLTRSWAKNINQCARKKAGKHFSQTCRFFWGGGNFFPQFLPSNVLNL